MVPKLGWKVFNFTAMIAILLSLNLALPGIATAQDQPKHRIVVVAKNAAEFAKLRDEVNSRGGRILEEKGQINQLVVEGSSTLKDQLAASPHAAGAALDRVVNILPPEMQVKSPTGFNKIDMGKGSDHHKVNPDPAFDLPGLMWDFGRINAQKAWKFTTGSKDVLVGVADTGLDFTHSELASKVVDVVDFTQTEDPNICSFFFGGPTDAELAAQFGGPENTDWNGHGSWIGGNIAAALDGVGINGIAPKVGLVALKISQWCGSAYDSEILDAFLYAADHGINIVSISFGGYLDLTDPDQQLIYQQYVQTVAYARSKGTTIIAAAGNEHVRVGANGLVLSHGQLTTPGSPVDDLFGLYENPGGVPGVVDVSATGNIVNRPSNNCPDDTAGSATNTSATCKPKSDAHQSFGIGRQNQLAYYSNYGPRIDIAAPGGARKFNLPVWDRGGTPGFPVTTADGFAAWETFSITSNWAVEIPCYINLGPEFYPNECYSSIQGTSMATPHVSAVAALIASANPRARHNPGLLIRLLKQSASRIHGNATPGLNATDTSPADLTGVACDGGYCHLGGPAIRDSEAYGAGLVNALGALK